MRSIARAFALFVALIGCAARCSVLVDADVSELRCSQEGMIGAPACDPGQLCSSGRCHACIALDVCGDGIDNDCDGRVDDGCRGEMSGGAGGQGPTATGGRGGATAGTGTDTDSS
jgi:hypothetical protein